MAGIVTPPVIVEPFGLHAAPANITLPIPVASPGVAGEASFDVGFPPETMIAEVAGGTPPFGQDFNGILYTVTASLAAMQAGHPWLYNATIVAAIGGYPTGTVLGMADGTGAWANTVAANVTDPDGGAPNGWVPVYGYGESIVGVTNANVTLTPAQWRKGVIMVTGVLTGNVRVIFPTGVVYQWLILNYTSGAFTVTAATAAGASLVIPQGGAPSPTAVYTEGTGIFTANAPLAVPISIAPTALSLVERDNSGYVHATYFNTTSGSAENQPIGAVFTEYGSDGFVRKVSPAFFISQLNLATLTAVASAITTALAPYCTTAAMNTAISAAVTPLAPKANPTLTGNVGVPTRTPGDTTANAASTAFVQAALAAFVTFSVGTTGSANLGGFIVQWGVVAHPGGGNQVHDFGAPFPSACFMCIPVVSDSAGVEFFSVIGSPTASNWTQYSNNPCNIRYIAIGN